MKYYFLYEEDGKEFVIECKTFDDALYQGTKEIKEKVEEYGNELIRNTKEIKEKIEKYGNELVMSAKILTKTELNSYLKEKGLKMIVVNKER